MSDIDKLHVPDKSNVHSCDMRIFALELIIDFIEWKRTFEPPVKMTGIGGLYQIINEFRIKGIYRDISHLMTHNNDNHVLIVEFSVRVLTHIVDNLQLIQIMNEYPLTIFEQQLSEIIESNCEDADNYIPK